MLEKWFSYFITKHCIKIQVKIILVYNHIIKYIIL